MRCYKFQDVKIAKNPGIKFKFKEMNKTEINTNLMLGCSFKSNGRSSVTERMK